jgi:Resolvase, N terminal domain
MVAMSYVQKWKGGYRIRRKIPPEAQWAFGRRREFLRIFGALAEFERHLVRERTLAGLKFARERGRGCRYRRCTGTCLGLPALVSKAAQARQAGGPKRSCILPRAGT